MENGQKTSIKQLSYQFCWIQVTFWVYWKTSTFSPFTKRKDPSWQVRAAQWTQGLNALQSLCGALLRPDVTTQAVIVMSDLGRSCMNRSLKCMGNSNPKESRRWTKVAFWQILPFQSVRIPIFLWVHLLRLVGLDRIFESTPPQRIQRMRLNNGKKWWHWKTILSSLKWSQFQVTGSGKTDLWGIGPFEGVQYFLLKGVFFFQHVFILHSEFLGKWTSLWKNLVQRDDRLPLWWVAGG